MKLTMTHSSTLQQISTHVYWLPPDSATDRPVLGVVAGQHGTLLIDAGNSPAHAQLLLEQVAKLPIAAPQFLVLTHWHWDHVFGTATLNLPTVAHAATKRMVSEMAQLDWSDEALDRRVEQGVEIEFCRDMIKAELPNRAQLTLCPPQIAFTQQIEIDLGGVTCQIAHVGGDHSADSTIVYIPEDKLLFLSDCLYQDLYHGEPSYSTQKLLPLITQLRTYAVDFYLWGHDAEPYSQTQMAAYLTLLQTIGRQVEQRGDSREAILVDLPAIFGAPLDEEQIEIVDAFLAGLRKIEASKGQI